MRSVHDTCAAAKRASRAVAALSTADKNEVLHAIADALVARADEILVANAEDVARGRAGGMTESLIDRLTLTASRIDGIADGLRQVAALKDPIGEVITGWTLENGLEVRKVRVPLGVVAMIYEARPNVTVDAAGLALKSGNACVLRGSSSAHSSNTAEVAVIREVLVAHGLPADAVCLIEDTSRETVQELMEARGLVDLLIPRGGAGLIQRVVNGAKVPVVETGIGVCHVYVDKAADLAKALPIILNAKVQRPSVCNSAETLLVHRDIAKEFLPKAAEALRGEGVTLYGTEAARAVVEMEAVTDEQLSSEYLDLKLSVHVVDGINSAIAHIDKHGSLHTEAIVTEDRAAARQFQAQVDAAAVMVNASTRFTDGEMFGFGAEIGISTQKMHARGPMALPELTTIKYLVDGDGQIRT